ncbi:MAG: DUF362 domain-containing protein [Acidobacteria bacterium]|nr:DUF362 domain-containing protein [Acidobacteriota bacterium]
MPFDRREFLAAGVAAATVACSQKVEDKQAAASAASSSGLKHGIPGPYPGRVVAIEHPGSIISGAYQAEPVRQMMERGMLELTHAENWADSWRQFFEPGDVVGIKVNPVGQPHVMSAPEVLHPIIDGLEQAGIKRKDIIVYDRYHDQFLSAGFDKWLPEGVRWMSASEKFLNIQMDMEGYDRDVYMEMPLVNPECKAEYSLNDPHVRRSYVSNFFSKEINKMVNLCVLKHHQSAGVTLALKNLSHGLVNNVNRSHASTTANACGIFIPAVVDLPIVREKVVLNILDGVKAAYHGGPGGSVGKYSWEHKTMYFATDPVALDKTGWKAIDAKRAEVGVPSIALLKPDEDSRWLNCHVEHIELAGNFGLGEFDDEKIRVKHINLG